MKTLSFGFILLVYCSTAFSQTDTVHLKELLQMRDADQLARAGLTVDVMKDTARMIAIERADSLRTVRLKGIVDSIGWPTLNMIGKEGLNAAFLIVQHSPDHQWQNSLLPTLKKQAMDGDLPKQDYAELADRILTDEGKPQIYGTQFQIVGDSLVADPIEDEKNLDTRRSEMGLMPFNLYKQFIQQYYKQKADTSSNKRK